ncbi:MAG: thiol reductant ABC exporter subunit CydC [Solirubrobacteraceae bacterium]|jgi:thiol reductant ABC exporter CydC subunit|nr:thiol reductant ABC exporter subunit CydC [Solirubrobacteraceae bacterium]MDP4673605.1 thiol reductant ABC exporter subunit CydC [Solirubrobacteraceae bacterium]MDP4921363.1 thiol reductant ABC exporter subunit CydC [Solirubrobacteraceae bacterium]
MSATPASGEVDRWRALMRAARLVSPRRGQLIFSIVLGAGAILAAVGLLAVAGVLISKAALQPEILTLTIFTVGVRALAFARALLRYGERLVSHDLAFRVLADLRVRFFERLIPLVPEGLRGVRSGDVLSRFVGDVDTLQDLYLRAIGPPLIGILTIAVLAVAVAIVLPAGAVVLIAGMLIAGLLVPALAARAGRRSGLREAPARAQLSAELVELVSGAGELAVYGREQQWAQRIEMADAKLAATERPGAWISGVTSGMGVAIGGVAMVAVAAIGVQATADGRLDGVLLAGIVFLTIGAFEAVVGLPDAAQRLTACAQAAARLESITEAPVPVSDPAAPIPVTIGGSLNFENVTVRFEGRAQAALSDVSAAMAPGSRIALVGASGAGKTTLASCAVRFLDPSSGRVTLGGTDIRELSQDALRSAVRLVSQEAYLFTTTIAQNVRLAAPEASEEQIIAALTRAGLGPWIASLPRGIETLVGEEGAEVSGGQRGRIALARGFIAPSQVVILDEPTANLDAAGARDLLSAIGSERSDRRAMLVITHTVEGLEEFDEIIVLEAGAVVERGTWGELIAAEGALARLSAAA